MTTPVKIGRPLLHNWVLNFVVLYSISSQPQAFSERHYQHKHCFGKIEHVLPDLTRVDCLTKTHAIEYEKGNRWSESIGQSLYYALQTGKRAGVVLIIEKPSHYRYWLRLNTTINFNNLAIDTWLIKSY